MGNQYEQLPELSAKHNEVHRGAYSSSGIFVDRGDPAVVDYDQTTLTSDGNYHDLDLSGVVPVGAKAVMLAIWYKHTIPGSYMRFRQNGNSYAVNCVDVTAQVNGIYFSTELIIQCDANRVIEYVSSSSPVGINVVVMGWFI
jgi:hypothetical protein